MSKLYDVFSFYNEGDLLDLRLHELWDVVDQFIVVEGDHTFAGTPITSYIKENWERYAWAEEKLRHVVVSLQSSPKSRWDNEALQRDGFSLGLHDAHPDDLILIGCVDEIPRKEVLTYYKERGGDVLTLFELQNFYYYFNGKDIGVGADFPCPVLTRRENITEGVHKLWDKRYSYPLTKNAGWHFSYLGGAEQIAKKLEAFSHSEFDTEYHKDPKRLEQVISQGGDIFDRPSREYEYVRIDSKSDFPTYLKENKTKFRKYIL